MDGAVAALEDKLRTMETLVLATRAEHKATKKKLQNTKRELYTTKRELQREQQTTVRELLTEQQTTKRELQKEQQTTKRKLQRELQTTKRDLQTSNKDRQTRQMRTPSSTFVHWGKSTCTSPNKLVYSGLVAGKPVAFKGAGTNALCLTKNPGFTTLPPWTFSLISGGHFYSTIKHRWENHVTCAVCLAPAPKTIMVPGNNTCPLGWITQYRGIVVAADKYSFATEYFCMDNDPESDRSHTFHLGVFNFHPVGVLCELIPCMWKMHGETIVCVVCSK